MTVTALEITQNNKVNNVSVFATHSPLVFLCEATYSGTPPESLEVQIFDESVTLLGTFNAIPYEDPTATRRVFAFIANDIIAGYMDDFKDSHISLGALIHQENTQKKFTIAFKSGLIFTFFEFHSVAAARQYGQTECLTDIVSNENDIYFGGCDQFVYVYVWNNSEANDITVDFPIAEDVLTDFDDSVFSDYDGKWLKDSQ